MPAVNGSVLHDPHLGRVRRGWLHRLFAADAPPTADPDVEDGAAAGELIEPSDFSDLAAMAGELTALIAAARAQVGGAATMVDASAEEAAAYCRALSANADAIGGAELPGDAVAALLTLTRAMIERSEQAERRLRASTGQLRALHQDLSRAEDDAARDLLTGLPSRAAMERALAIAVEAARAANRALAVARCAIDDLPRLHEVHGAALGNRLVRLVGDCLEEGAGAGAIVGRDGADGFVLLFDGAGALEAAARVDAMRAALAARSLRSRSDGRPVGQVSFSAGVAGLAGGGGPGELLERSAAALARARADGCNQVVIDDAG